MDLSQPISVLLKESTREAHDKAENSPGAKALSSGALQREDYVKYLMILWHVYNAMENALDAHNTHPSLSPSYNPSLLRRTESLSSDISHFLSCPSTLPSAWQQTPLYTTSFTLTLPPPLTAYLTRLQTISSSPDPTPLLAHAYVRYLGDLSGGQFIKRILGKVYGVDASAMTFYDFHASSSGKTAGMGDMKRVKEWFKCAMDEGIGEDLAKKRGVVNEAQEAFRLNGELLDYLAATSTSTSTGEGPKMKECPIHSKKAFVAYVAPKSSWVILPLVGLLIALNASRLLGGWTPRTAVTNHSTSTGPQADVVGPVPWFGTPAPAPGAL